MKLKSIFILLSVLLLSGVVYILLKQPPKEEPVEYQPFIWDFNMDALQHIEIILPKTEQREAWVLHEDRYFYFDVENGTRVDMARWGGGVPLILSGPSAARVIYENLPDYRLAEFGFTEPNMIINLTLNDAAEYHILVGDSTPSGNDYYIKMVGESNIYTVDKIWYEVVSGLVSNPPYEPAIITVQDINFVPAQPSAGQPFVIRATITNNGILSNPEPVDIILKFHGDVVEPIQQITDLAGGASLTVDYNMEGKAAGTYSININGKIVRLEIK